MKKIKQDLQPLFEVLPPWIKWIAKDENWGAWGYERKPEINNREWVADKDSGVLLIPQQFIPQSYKDLDWEKSLIKIKKTKNK